MSVSSLAVASFKEKLLLVMIWERDGGRGTEREAEEREKMEKGGKGGGEGGREGENEKADKWVDGGREG